MSEQTFTYGPWRVVNRPQRGLQIEWGGDADGVERPICHMRWTDGLRQEVTARVEADAHLIAAAPELLASLKDLVCDVRDGNPLKVAALAAIAKAEWRETPVGG